MNGLNIFLLLFKNEEVNMDRYQIIRIINDYMSRYEKKNKSDSQKCIRLPLSFFSFYFFYGLSFSLFPYQKGFILLLIRFPIFR